MMSCAAGSCAVTRIQSTECVPVNQSATKHIPTHPSSSTTPRTNNRQPSRQPTTTPTRSPLPTAKHPQPQSVHRSSIPHSPNQQLAQICQFDTRQRSGQLARSGPMPVLKVPFTKGFPPQDFIGRSLSIKMDRQFRFREAMNRHHFMGHHCGNWAPFLQLRNVSYGSHPDTTLSPWRPQRGPFNANQACTAAVKC
jgi:hypothetical protein